MAIGGDTQLYAIYKRHSIDIKCVKIKEYNKSVILILDKQILRESPEKKTVTLDYQRYN